jgi:type I restriction enzyme S subunit
MSMAKQGARTTVPKLRFPEFREADGWMSQRLGDVALFLKGKGLPKSDIAADGRRPCIHYGELFTDYQEVIRTVQSWTDSDEHSVLSVDNDVLMPTSDVTPRGLAKACCVRVCDVILGGDILVIRTDRHAVSGEFLARQIRHSERRVLQLVTGTTVFHLYASAMEKLTLAFTSMAEQIKFADCMMSLY